MIQANELRIGNYVVKSEQVTSNSPEYGQITTVYIDKAVVDYHYPLTWYKPIPLTEEWLLKFGFVSSMFEDNVFIHYNGMKYFLETQQLHFLTIELNCKYVHILQNIYFALTGEELTIKE